MHITHVLRGEDLLSSTPRQLALYAALVELGIAESTPAVRAPALRHGRGQQEALQARPAGQPAQLPRERLPARGPAQLPGTAGLGDLRRPRHLLDRGDGGGVRDRATSTPTPPASTSRRPRPSTPPTCGCCRSRRSAAAPCPTSPPRAWSPTRRPPSSSRCSTLRCRWSPSASTSSPRPSTCSASCSSTRPTSRGSTRSTRPAAASSRRRTTRSPGCRSGRTTAIEEALRVALVEELGLKPRNAFGPVRIAVTGRKVSPPLFESLELLGRERSLGRLAVGSGVSEPAMTSPAAGPAYDGPRGLPYHLVLLGGRPGWWRFLVGVAIVAAGLIIVAPLVLLLPFAIWFLVDGQPLASSMTDLLDLERPDAARAGLPQPQPGGRDPADLVRGPRRARAATRVAGVGAAAAAVALPGGLPRRRRRRAARDAGRLGRAAVAGRGHRAQRPRSTTSPPPLATS